VVCKRVRAATIQKKQIPVSYFEFESWIPYGKVTPQSPTQIQRTSDEALLLFKGDNNTGHGERS